MRENYVPNTFFLVSGVYLDYFKLIYWKEVPLFQKNFPVYSGPRCKEEPQKNSRSSRFSFIQKPNLRNAIKLCPEIEIFAFFLKKFLPIDTTTFLPIAMKSLRHFNPNNHKKAD